MTTVKLTDIIAPSFFDFHKDLKSYGHTYYMLNGGRGSTKSSVISVEIVFGIMKDPMANAVILRKVKDTLKDSVFEQLTWAIEALGVSDYWEIPEAKLVLTYLPTGQEIRFRGADKPKKIKSMKFSKGYCKYLWYEELDEFAGMEEVRMINQSLMRGGEHFVVFYSYNPPKSANNWVNVEAKLTRNDRYTLKTNYLSVPKRWLGEQFFVEANHLKETNIKAYEHEYLGDIVGTGGEVFDNVSCRAISDEEIADFHNVKRGLDFGYAVDPLSYLSMHYDSKYKRLYIFSEFYKAGLSNLAVWRFIKDENILNTLVYADSAEPKSINELSQYGMRVAPVKKGPDSIEFGIRFLQSLEAIIIDDTRCPETAREFLSYELDRDNNGNFKAGYPDRNNHSIDATRYALNEETMRFKEQLKEKAKVGLTIEEKVRLEIAGQGRKRKAVNQML